LVLTTYETWPRPEQSLRVHLNRLGETGNWIAFRLTGGRGAVNTTTTVELALPGRRMARHTVAGDSHRSQHPPAVHFGLGTATEVERVRLIRANGEIAEWPRPAINRMHRVDYGTVPGEVSGRE